MIKSTSEECENLRNHTFKHIILFGGFWVEMVAFRENLYNLAPQDGNATLHLQH